MLQNWLKTCYKTDKKTNETFGGEDDANKALIQDNPEHGEGTGETERCGESPIFICLFGFLFGFNWIYIF